MPLVQTPRVFRLNPLQAPGQRLATLRNHEQVDVVGHRAPTQDFEPFDASVALQQIQILGAVVVREENGLPVVPASGDVKREAGFDQP